MITLTHNDLKSKDTPVFLTSLNKLRISLRLLSRGGPNKGPNAEESRRQLENWNEKVRKKIIKNENTTDFKHQTSTTYLMASG